MKKHEVKVGGTYTVKVSGQVVPVKITQEKWAGDKHVGWVGVNTKTDRPVRIKSAQRLRAQAGAGGSKPPTTATTKRDERIDAGLEPLPVDAGIDPTAFQVASIDVDPKVEMAAARRHAGRTGGRKSKGAKERKAEAAKATKPKRVSALDAAAQVLGKSDKPMTSTALVDAMAKAKLWTSPGGKTPEATLYAAMLREIASKGGSSRFKKVDRGLFVANA